MNEFDQSQQLSDLQALKEMKPSWMAARVEPFIPPADSDVKSPEWGKTIITNRNLAPSDTGGSGVQPGVTKVICAVQSGSTYIPKLMTPVQGTLFEDP